MTRLTPAHLPPLAAAFEQALREGAIPLADAMRFVERIETPVLEFRAGAHHRQPANKDDSEGAPSQNPSRETTP